MIFGVLYFLNRYLNKEACSIFIKDLLNIFDLQWNEMFTDLHLGANRFMNYGITKVVFLTFTEFFKRVKSQYIIKNERVNEYKEIP